MFPSADIDIVDLNTELFSVSNEFFFPIDSANVRWFAEDAAGFVKKADRRYDYICCDIWGHHLQVPGFLIERDFIQSVKNIVSAQGVFAISTNKFLHQQMAEMFVSEFEFVFSVPAPTCLLIAMNVPPKALTDGTLIADLLSKNLDVNDIRTKSMVIRLTRPADFVGKAD
jgi:spermidine synthase